MGRALLGVAGLVPSGQLQLPNDPGFHYTAGGISADVDADATEPIETLTQAIVRLRLAGYAAEISASPEGNIVSRSCGTTLVLRGWCFSGMCMLAFRSRVIENDMHGVVVGGVVVTVGLSPTQADLLKGSGFVGERVGEDSIFAILHRGGHRLIPDDMFADLYKSTGRRSVPPQILATVMLLQRLVRAV